MFGIERKIVTHSVLTWIKGVIDGLFRYAVGRIDGLFAAED
jgi:hypothetical protein